MEQEYFGVSLEKLLTSGGQTLYMVAWSLIIGTIIGISLALILVLCRKGGLIENLILYNIVSIYINIVRSIPFVILLVAIMPLTRAIVGTTIGSTASLVPLVIYISPYLARLMENSLLEINPGILEAAEAMGASTWQTIRYFLLPETLGSIVLALTTGTIGLLGASAMAGYVGGGGVGDLALTYGYQRMNTPLMIFTVVVLVVFETDSSACRKYNFKKTQTTQIIFIKKRMRNKENNIMKIKKIIAGLLVATTAFSLAACGNSGSGDTKKSDADTSEKKEIVYGKSQGPYTELFEDAIVPILEKEGYTLKAVDLSDLQTADVALNDGDVDVNVEQHTAYMDSFNQSYNADLVAISPIPTVPAGVYSEKYDSVDEIPDGAKVAVPNDASNTARCYLMLQKIGWIKLDENADPSTVTQDDIVENPHNIEFTEMNSMTIPAAESDFDYIAITGSVVYNAGIDASTALANEDISDYLVLQVVVKEENKDADWAKAIVDAYHSDEFKQYMKENNDGLWWIPEELQ